MSHGAEVGVLQLAAEPASVPAARHMVRRVMAGHASDLVDSAEICISELVTNAVLHARTPVEVRLADLGERIRLEVRDSAATMPRRLVHTARSATGRGMEVVSLIAWSWGVDLLDDGVKAVWCELEVAAPSVEAGQADADAILAAWSEDTDPLFPVWSDDGDPIITGGERRPAPAASAPTTPGDGAAPAFHVVLAGYPVLLGMRAREHNDAILRECALLSQADETSAPARLVGLATMLTSSYAGELTAADEQRTAAYFAGATSIDMHYPLVSDVRGAVEVWGEVMRELDAFAEGNALLTLATPPEMVELRAWTVEEFVRQSEGHAPRPWPGPLD